MTPDMIVTVLMIIGFYFGVWWLLARLRRDLTNQIAAVTNQIAAVNTRIDNELLGRRR